MRLKTGLHFTGARECSWLILFEESSRGQQFRTSVAYYETERNHQGSGNTLILPDPAHAGTTGSLPCRERLGGMLNYYYRSAA